MLKNSRTVMFITPENYKPAEKLMGNYPYECEFTKNSINVISVSNNLSQDGYLKALINKHLSPGDIIIAENASTLASSNQEMLKILKELVVLRISLHITNGDIVFEPENVVTTLRLLELCRAVDSQISCQNSKAKNQKTKKFGVRKC